MGQQQDTPLIGESPAFHQVLDAVSKIAPLNRPVLVIGERGTGKELIADRIHYLSARWDQTFVKLNCAALPESLLESELFGHEAGSFTGAGKMRKGRFELADQGTLFLDELANTPATVQEKILRVIEYGEFERVGGSNTVEVDTRIIAATNDDLPKLVEENKFRADLLDRLAFDVITLPPLRYRTEDILPLAEHFGQRMAAELNFELFPGFSSDARKALQSYQWPGNIRELKNVVERAVYRTDPDAESVDEIQFDPFESPYRPGSSQPPTPVESVGDEPELTGDFKQRVKDFEIRLLNQAMASCQFNQRKAAEQLGLTYHQLRGYLRKYQLIQQD